MIASMDLGPPQYYRMLWRDIFELEEYHDLFGGVKEEGSCEWSMGMTEDQVFPFVN